VVLLDVSMPGIGGLRALEEFLKMDSEAVIVMITAYATVRHRDRGVGARRVWLHQKAVSERTDHGHDSGRNQTTAQGRRTARAAARDE
jgi:CheY-like chemotaxis protein